jgi:hypothetical protein
VNSINDTGDIRTYNAGYSFRARYTAGSDNYHASLNWYGLQLGNNGDNYIIAGRTNPGGNFRFYVNNTSDFTSVNGTLAAIMHSSGRTSFGTPTDAGYMVHVAGDIYANGGWLRVGGSQGLYFESYGGGWRMTDSSYIRSYNAKALSMEGASVDYVGSIYMNGGVYIQTNNNRNLQVKSTGSSDVGILGLGSGGQFGFQVYGSGGDYGFLDGAWAAWDLRKTVDGRLYMNDTISYYLQTNSNSYVYRIESATDMRAPIFYDSDNTGYYLDPNAGSNIGYLQTNSGPSMTGGWNRSLYLSATFPVVVFNSYNTKYSGIGVDYSGSDAGFIFWVNGSSADISGTGAVAMRIHTGNFVSATNSFRAPIFYDSDNTNYYADFANSGTSIYTAGGIRTAGMIMKGYESGGVFGGQIYPTVSSAGVSLYGGNNFTNGAYFTVTGIDYGSSPGAGSAEFVIRTAASSKFAMYSYNGSTWTGRYSLWGSTGNVTIGSATTDYGYKLYVLGVIYATGNVTAYSDARVKTNIRPIDNVLDRVSKSRGVVYDRIDIESDNNIGFIAQELEEQFPELVSTDKEGRKGVMYQNMVAVLLEAVKEQQKEINQLKTLINGSSN